MKDEIERLQKLLEKATPNLTNGTCQPKTLARYLKVGASTDHPLPDNFNAIDLEHDATFILAAIRALPELLGYAKLADPPDDPTVKAVVDRLNAPLYWWCGSSPDDERVDTAPVEAADLLVVQAARVFALEAENAELLRLNTVLQGRPLWGQQ